MTKQAQELTPAWRGRVTYLIAVVIGWFFVDVFDGLVFSREAVEHWAEAAWWAAAALGYVALALRRPLPAEHRLADMAAVVAMAIICVGSALRATLPDETAFRWSMVMLAAYLVAVWLAARHWRGRTRVSANQSPS